ncbi:MAG TPA: 50S ribosomal protein L11 methyltransferase [Flavitalea sp.]|nr:50S ribosomal protein L11 methyltransferase [Flavitalea sp.]
MNVFTKVIIPTEKPWQRDLLSGLMGEKGYDGFEEEQTAFNAYIRRDAFDRSIIEAILSPLGLGFYTEEIPAVNWNEEWEKSFVPVEVGNFCSIRASFHEASKDVTHDIIITPRMSFGTGHHATTYLMIRQMQGLSFDGSKVLDFGTGTGVLAILSEKLGASEILAIDNDEMSVENAIDNVRENGCVRITVENADQIKPGGQYDIILANISRNVLLEQMHNVAQHLSQDGVVLMSGLLSGDQEIIEEKVREAALGVNKTDERDGWIVLRLVHK